jgi:hypothetical protein
MSGHLEGNAEKINTFAYFRIFTIAFSYLHLCWKLGQIKEMGYCFSLSNENTFRSGRSFFSPNESTFSSGRTFLPTNQGAFEHNFSLIFLSSQGRIRPQLDSA